MRRAIARAVRSALGMVLIPAACWFRLDPNLGRPALLGISRIAAGAAAQEKTRRIAPPGSVAPVMCRISPGCGSP
jgi:hypothetical protein